MLRATEVSEQLRKTIERKLRVSLPLYGKPGKFIERLYYEPDAEGGISVPRYFAASFCRPLFDAHLKTDDPETYPKIQKGLVMLVQLLNTPMKPQVEPVRQVLEMLRKLRGAQLIAPPGTGKTVMAIKVSHDVGLQTFVLANKDDLIGQWIDRIRQCLGDKVKIGVIKQNTCEFEGCDFVVCSIQSLYSRRESYPEAAFRAGMLIVDESHHTAAPTFAAVVHRFRFAYSLGLTGTPPRGKNISDFILGPVACRIELPPNPDVQVNLISFDGGQRKEIVYKNGTIGVQAMIGKLVVDRQRNQLLIDLIRMLHRSAPGRKGLVLSARVDHLKELYILLNDPSISAVITGEVHSDKTRSEVNADKRARKSVVFDKFITFSTFSLLSEAIDFDGNFVLLATPQGNVEQATGRIMRGRESRFKPVIIDVMDTFSVFETWSFSRNKFYKSRGYTRVEVRDVHVTTEARKYFPPLSFENTPPQDEAAQKRKRNETQQATRRETTQDEPTPKRKRKETVRDEPTPTPSTTAAPVTSIAPNEETEVEKRLSDIHAPRDEANATPAPRDQEERPKPRRQPKVPRRRKASTSELPESKGLRSRKAATSDPAESKRPRKQ